ncbi:hypothetical protein BV25DRAFT_1822576 [Artomyces pyxidatus]|uniref:Uncharacterized protein n=1 Tax=Artomyces pyxidatus TaxID=48021 RepID=A0ACB8T7J0_9AGAM|nr:hypothetical protein BV25DRAFT_1822576 [Artomyces pyxidatus]
MAFFLRELGAMHFYFRSMARPPTLQVAAALSQDDPFGNLVPYSVAAIGALLVYDYLCTLDQEVEHVWSGTWTVGKALFILNRYPPFVDTFISLKLLTSGGTPEDCRRQFIAVTWLISSGVIVSELILMLRTYAIWERQRWVLILLSTAAAVLYIPALVVTQMETKSFIFASTPPGETGCSLQHASAIIFLAYVLLLISETLIFTLTVIKAVQHLKRTRSPMVVTLYRDGVLFYFCLLFFTVANVVVPVAAPPALANWLATPQRAMHSLMCTRVLLSIHRGRYDTQFSGAANVSTVPVLSSLWLSSGTDDTPPPLGRSLSLTLGGTSNEGPATDEAFELVEHRPRGSKDRMCNDGPGITSDLEEGASHRMDGLRVANSGHVQFYDET